MATTLSTAATPYEIFVRRILKPEKKFYQATIIYTVALSMLTLAVPLSVQSLINSVANTALPQAVLSVTIILFGLMAFYATLTMLQYYAMELFERRFFTRVTAELVEARLQDPEDPNETPFNRFFEVMHVQKSVPSLMIGGFSLFLQTIVGLIVVSFYHPFLLVFTLLLVLGCLISWRIWHRQSQESAMALSAQKYEVADWLEHIEHAPSAAKRIQEAARCEQLNGAYLDARKRFFRYSFRKNIMFMAIYVVASVSLLGLGGLLVIQGQLSLGQLVAAELILSAILAGLSKCGYYLTLYYELCAAASKLDNLLHRPENAQHTEPSHPQAWQQIKIRGPVRLSARLTLVALMLFIAALVFIPWVQTAYGTGAITAMNPGGQLQSIHALVKGRIKEWYVRDGSAVNAGDPIVEIIDNDPELITRIQSEADAARRAREAARIAAETASIDFHRKEDLLAKGLAARHEMERAKIAFTEWQSKEADAVAKLNLAETKLSRQQTQLIRAPKSGVIMRTAAGDLATMVKEGDVVATFVPDDSQRAVELYVSGLDVPLIYPGRRVRLQFEGWPAVQFSGWPSLAIGTFSGEVKVVAPSVSPNGKFRILVGEIEGETWPDARFLRFGGRANGWVLLNTVSLGYELWRQMNGFPPENAALKENAGKQDAK